MTSMILFLFFREDKTEAAFARYTAAMNAMPSYEVQVVSKDKRRLDIPADLIIDGRRRLLYDATTPAGHYILTITPDFYREVDYPTMAYDEYPAPPAVHVYESRVSRVTKTIPVWLAATDLHQIMEPGSKLSYIGNQNVNGQPCDVIRATFRSPMASGYTEFSIGNTGLVYRNFESVNAPDGHIEVSWEFKDYKPFKTMSASRFENRIPDGFMPFSLPDHDIPIAIGKKPIFRGWVDSKSGKPWSPAPGKPTLFVLMGQDSLPSERAKEALADWQSMLKQKGIAIAIASDSASSAGANGLLYDPDRRSLKGLMAPSTPMLFLMDSGGTLRNLWMGFEPDQAATLREDLFKAIAALK